MFLGFTKRLHRGRRRRRRRPPRRLPFLLVDTVVPRPNLLQVAQVTNTSLHVELVTSATQ